MDDNEKLIEEARGWIEDLLRGNGFGNDYTRAELNAWAKGLVRHFAPKPQGEPSDAQVLAALDAFFQGQSSNLSDFGSVSVQGMRTALRAAGGVR